MGFTTGPESDTTTLEEASAGWLSVSPAKVAVTGTDPTVWFTTATVQLAAPDTSVVAVQVCAVPPVPSVNVTVFPDSGVPADGLSVVSNPDNVTGCPFTAEVSPVYVSVVAFCGEVVHASVTGLEVKVCALALVKLAWIESVPTAVDVYVNVASPFASVVPVPVSPALGPDVTLKLTV